MGLPDLQRRLAAGSGPRAGCGLGLCFPSEDREEVTAPIRQGSCDRQVSESAGSAP